ncbi:MAG: NADP-dependent isocitrate dehydrogenase [Alphaproteobacteria bacterium]|nr:NADP-dependent isocitrate dehydrogenase [Alphaproteobacteria bacterium]MBU1281443.1 NADP-dependent isocitrate dehydrogenase [Alphaproteobacteria bacterium]MBU1573656.1 NADP-dependent isocitrate dehydrogenase [Alphaproteobacteria bacterium]MBU1828862.1 NADP-dependent isocitrate dehydrogenase [Alphaproteobacteria bacterium]MBU2080167.1 NADP-dependent isocitrate dehydrogenase [Alphaproteobacteria bacterium]
MAQETPDIIYTIVDEAPELARGSLLPIITSFSEAAGINVETRDISVAARILALFPELLSDDQKVSDDLAELGELVKTPEANVIKLPNVSASVPQLEAAIKELQSQGYPIPSYPADPQTDAEKAIRAKYDTIKGSAVNPVLREGNSDRRSAKAVKEYAKANPHRMGTWTSASKTTVASMPGNDFFANEKAATITGAQAGGAKIVFTATDGTETVLKSGLKYAEGEVVDATFLSAKALRAYIKAEVESMEPGVLFSVHLKATMMKVSDPIIFGHFVSVYLEDFIAKHGASLEWNPNDGIGELDKLIADNAEMKADLKAALDARPPLYMVNSDKGITNLHVPSDVIIDASMPAVIKAGGIGWGPDGKAADTKCCIPDNSYACVYDETVEYFKETGTLDVTTCGAVSNVGLMAQKAEEYGSHPTTFEMKADGKVEIVLDNGDVLHSHAVEAGDIWRSCTAKKAPILDWIQLGIERFDATGTGAFWLDANRAHDAELIKYVAPALKAAGKDIPIMAPREATRFSFVEMRKGKDVVTITGNVLRDYLTDLFPILELGTSAKMLSIVKLMNGGGMFETGAGGSAPKHVQQVIEENHLRWDSLGEFCALGESYAFLAASRGKAKAAVLATAVEDATQKLLLNGKSPERKVGENDNRSSHYWFARYWAEALAAQSTDAALAAHFAPIAKELVEKEEIILDELKISEGEPADLGGYYHADPAKVASVMRPSATLNAIIG